MFFCSKRKKGKNEEKVVLAFSERVGRILEKLDDYIKAWSPRFVTTSDIYTDVSDTSKKCLEMLRNTASWLKAMPINSSSEQYIKRLEGALDELRDNYFKPHGLTAVVYAVDTLWATVTEWSENKY